MKYVLAFLLLLLTGCMVGPKYSKPSVPMTPAYKEPPPESFKETKDWKTAQPGAPEIAIKWWEIFGDPQLNALEEQVASGNQDLKAAEARFREARALIRFNRAAEFPTISVGPSINSLRFSSNRPNFRNSTATGDFVLPFDFSYEVDLWGRVRRTVAAAREETQASAADLAAATLSIQAEVAFDYFELRSADGRHREGVRRCPTAHEKPVRRRGGAEIRRRTGANPVRYDACAGHRHRCAARRVRTRDCSSSG